MSWTSPGHVPGMWTCPKIVRTELNGRPCFGHFLPIHMASKWPRVQSQWIKNIVTNSFYCVSRRILLCRIQIWFLIYFYNFSIFKIHFKNVLAWSGKIWGQWQLIKMSQDIVRPCPGHVLCPVMCPQIFSGQARPLPTKIGSSNPMSFLSFELSV